MQLTADRVTREFMRKRGTSNVFNAVEGVSLTLENGTITVITGPSGSGKSTLLNMMAGILTPTSGTIKIGSTDLYQLDDDKLSAFRNEHIGVVPQGQTALHSLDVMDNVLLPYMLYKGKHKAEGTNLALTEDNISRRAEELLQRTGIGDLAEVSPTEMSGGEIRRMAIARAMIMKPDVILADEPTADLDEDNTKEVLSLMQYAAKEGSAVMIVTHDKDVFPWADKVYRLRAGHMEEGS